MLTDMSKKSLEILNNPTPFHRAISLFESNDVKLVRESFELFYALTQSGNLVAPFYLKDMLDSGRVEANTIEKLMAVSALTAVSGKADTVNSVTATATTAAVDIQPNISALTIFTEALTERLQSIPNSIHADYYLKASKVIQKLEGIATLKAKVKKTLLEELESLLPMASNAALFFLKVIELKNGTVKFEKNLRIKLENCIDITVIYKLKVLGLLPPVLELEYVQIEKFAMLAYPLNSTHKVPNTAAALERLIFQMKPEREFRKSAWGLQAALMGSTELQRGYGYTAKTEGEKDHWFECAAVSGDCFSQMKVGTAAYHQQGTFKLDKHKARKYTEIGLNNAKEKDYKEYPNTCRDAILVMAYLWMRGEGGLDCDVVKGFMQFKKADEQAGGSFYSAFNLGLFYEEGRIGLSKNHKLAAEYYEKAISLAGSDLKNMEVHSRVASLYSKGEHGLLQNDNKAADHFKIAMTSDLHALTFYGLFLYRGRGVVKNEKEGLNLLKLAAEQQSYKACFQLLRILYRENPGLALTVDEIKQYLETFALYSSRVSFLLWHVLSKTR